MPRTSTTALATGAAAAFSLVFVAAGPVYAAHQPAKSHLAHTHITLRAAQEKMTKHNKFKATVVARLRSHKQGVAGENVELFQRTKGATKWVDAGIGSVTDSTGAATFHFVQTESKQKYRATFAGDATYQKSHSGVITIRRAKAAKA
jgi:hypothetical protein